MKENGNKILTIQEVSAYLKIPVSTIDYLAQQGKLQGRKFGRHWRFLEEDIINYFRFPVSQQ